MRVNLRNALCLLAFCMAGALPLASLAADKKAPDTVDAITQPSQQGKLNFLFPGIVRDVLVKEGDTVTAGKPLMVQDDEIEQREFEKLQNEANSSARYDAAVADLAVKKKVEERKKAQKDGFTKSEIEEAELDVVFRENQVKVAEVEHKSAEIEAKKQQARVDRMTLKSPIDGIVQKIDVYKGEFAEPDKTKAAMVVVKNDPCNVEIRELTTAEVAMLNVGDTLEVKTPGQQEWQQAKIIFIDPVADAQSGTQFVKLEMPNPSNKTGLHVEVKKPAAMLERAAADKTALNR